MNRPALERGPTGSRSPPDAERILCPGILEFRRHAAVRDQAKDLAVKSPDDSTLRATEPRRIVHQRLQNPLQVERGVADDFQHLARGGLLLQRLGQFLVARLELPEQPYILNGDDRLVSEGLEQFDLLVRE